VIYPHVRKLILLVIARNVGTSQKEIIFKTGFSERCVRNNLKFLEERNLISSSRDFRNLNFKQYKIKEDFGVVV